MALSPHSLSRVHISFSYLRGATLSVAKGVNLPNSSPRVQALSEHPPNQKPTSGVLKEYEKRGSEGGGVTREMILFQRWD